MPRQREARIAFTVAAFKHHSWVPQTEKKINLYMSFIHPLHSLTTLPEQYKESSTQILLFLFFNQRGIGAPTSTAARIFGTGIADCGVESDAAIFSFLFEHHS